MCFKRQNKLKRGRGWPIKKVKRLTGSAKRERESEKVSKQSNLIIVSFHGFCSDITFLHFSPYPISSHCHSFSPPFSLALSHQYLSPSNNLLEEWTLKKWEENVAKLAAATHTLLKMQCDKIWRNFATFAKHFKNVWLFLEALFTIWQHLILLLPMVIFSSL